MPFVLQKVSLKIADVVLLNLVSPKSYELLFSSQIPVVESLRILERINQGGCHWLINSNLAGI